MYDQNKELTLKNNIFDNKTIIRGDSQIDFCNF